MMWTATQWNLHFTAVLGLVVIRICPRSYSISLNVRC